jgi:ribosome-binding protein aMBF1 (putative translation factor)
MTICDICRKDKFELQVINLDGRKVHACKDCKEDLEGDIDEEF